METKKMVCGKRTKKRWLALVFAILLAFQPAMSIFASDLEQATVRGDGYVIRTQPNGEKTITFEADLIAGSVEDTVEKSRSEKMRVQYADKETKSVRLPEVVSSVEEGCLASKTNGKGETTTYTYDTDSNLIRTEYADGSSVELVWDESGRLISSEGADGKTSYQYDADGNLQSVSLFQSILMIS